MLQHCSGAAKAFDAKSYGHKQFYLFIKIKKNANTKNEPGKYQRKIEQA